MALLLLAGLGIVGASLFCFNSTTEAQFRAFETRRQSEASRNPHFEIERSRAGKTTPYWMEIKDMLSDFGLPVGVGARLETEGSYKTEGIKGIPAEVLKRNDTFVQIYRKEPLFI